MKTAALLFAALSCFGAARTASVTGNWSSTTTWGGLSVPGNGDTVTVNSGITVTVDDARTIGTSPASCTGTQAIQINSGILAVAGSGTLTMRGCATLAGTGQLTVVGTGHLQFDASIAAAPASTHYIIKIGAANGDTALVSLAGTNSSTRCLVDSNSGGGSGSFSDGGFNRGGMVQSNQCAFQRIGTAAINAMTFNPTSNSDIFFLKNGSCDLCGEILQDSFQDAATITFDGMTWTNSYTNPLQIGGYMPTLGATITNNVFDLQPLFYTPRGMTITNNVFLQGWGNTSGGWATFDTNLYVVDATHNNGYEAEGNMSNVYATTGATLTNPHFLNMDEPTDMTMDSWILEDLGSTSDGDCFIPYTAAATYTIQNSIKLPNSAGTSTCAFGSQGGGINSHLAFYKNTIFLGGGRDSSGNRIGETYPGNAGMVSAMKSNLFWDTSARGWKFYCLTPACTILDAVTGANADYNGGLSTQFLAGSAGKGYDNTFTVPPGSHDLDADAMFVDSARNLAKWDLSLGGPGTAANALSQLGLHNSPSWNSAYNISALLTYVRAGFAPTNVAFATAGHDGGRIGAVPVVGSAPVITPSATGGGVTVRANTTQQFIADQTVTWSLVAGSGGSISAGGLYTAPVSVTANNAFLGIQALPNDHVLNTRVDNLPVQAGWTSYLHSQIVAAPIHFGVGFGDNRYTNSTPTSAMVFNYTPLNNGTFPIPRFVDINVDGGVYSDPRETDSHILGVNIDTGQFSELYKLYPIGSEGAPPVSCVTCSSQSGYKYVDDYTQPPNGTTDASGMPILPLSIRYSELAACAAGGAPIKHAGRFSLSNGLLATAFVWPATTNTSQGNTIPYGARIRLKAAFDISGFTVPAQCILTMLKNYGMLVADGGINMDVSVMQDAADTFEFQQMFTLELYGNPGFNSDQFEFVDESSLRDMDATSPAYLSGRVSPDNVYVVPANFVTVKACNAMTQCSTMPVILRPVTIGTTQSVGYSFMAGTPIQLLPVWVTGTGTPTFSCAMSPALGTLSSDCHYTPPSTSGTRQTTTVTVTATADSSQTLSFPLWVYPQGGIREHLSPDTNVDYGPDVSGNVWFAEAGSIYRPYGVASCFWQNLILNPWNQSTPDIALYYKCGYDSNDDFKHTFYVPNGVYTVTMLFGVGGTVPFASGYWLLGIDSQGVVYGGSSATTLTTDGAFSFLGVTGKYVDTCNIVGACANVTPGQVTFSATVTDNTIYVADRHVAFYMGSATFNLLTAISIVPNSTTFTGSLQSGPGRAAGPAAVR